MNIQPSYLNLYRTGELRDRIKTANSRLASCSLCPRNCGINRLHDERGYCNSGLLTVVSSFNAHFGEEPPISGTSGSGTIFFTNCNLKCCFCQNYPISQFAHGDKVRVDKLADMMIALQERGCHNINFVSPTHFVAQVLQALGIAVEKGLNIPLVYNSGGYDSIDTLKLLDGIISIYMPDMKYSDNEMAEKYSSANGYVEVNRAALLEMHRQVGDLAVEDGVAYKGLLIRHLVLPDGISGSREAL